MQLKFIVNLGVSDQLAELDIGDIDTMAAWRTLHW